MVKKSRNQLKRIKEFPESKLHLNSWKVTPQESGKVEGTETWIFINPEKIQEFPNTMQKKRIPLIQETPQKDHFNKLQANNAFPDNMKNLMCVNIWRDQLDDWIQELFSEERMQQNYLKNQVTYRLILTF